MAGPPGTRADAGMRRGWTPDLAVGGAVLMIGLLEISWGTFYTASGSLLMFVLLGTAAAVTLSRQAPGVALALVWIVCSVQVLSVTPTLLTQLAIACVAFGTARWGSTLTVWLSGLSIPAAALVGVFFFVLDHLTWVEVPNYRNLLEAAYGFGDTWQVGAVMLGALVLAAPWLLGLALRFGARARDSRVSQLAAEEDAARAQVETAQAQEIARLREEQARLARDVHDVVGHSLAVILAQAESAQYLPGEDPEALKMTMRTIATSARSSLQDVRQVLTTTRQPASRPGGLDSLVDGVRSSGHEVVSTEVGTPQPLPPELETVAFRVLQEMLTNAMKHGRRDTPVRVERHWEGDLRLEVRNGVDTSADQTMPIATRDPAGSPGQGLEGMRRRLESVGGRLDVRRRGEDSGQTFTATAWLPLRTVAP
ncbi:sensor histidine kinase [Nocardioides sp. LHG3406-4]|uniref:sensor histidine kinase n=1 Tax=Nocardioides sp. LHG3406-4 TaxID=2804575 RepID=UPI003CE8522B